MRKIATLLFLLASTWSALAATNAVAVSSDLFLSVCYDVVGPSGRVGSIDVFPQSDGSHVWQLPDGGGSGVFTSGGGIEPGGEFGSITLVELGGVTYADLDFRNLPPNMPTHYTLEPCFQWPGATSLGRNPFRVVVERRGGS